MNKVLKELVIKEAQNLRKFAYKSELARLSAEHIDAEHSEKCVYGQMTGDCFSNRANNLIIKCCEKVYKVVNRFEDENYIQKAKLNGAPHKVQGTDRNHTYYSPIEKALITMTNKQKQELVNYLKGETETLVL